ncbi:GyrI-like domain-containing protein [Pseudonocardia sp. HH130630-07]|uniref:GyrI-like domain-containing protein n=1 Tax=Pseudonocardia sp. HH130630-07 TaxID=1690815 RepID=UPI000814E868|nr:GyrI-like domain-containing protein [Pseudonocardia sp. HH130630-07]ANY05149.1 hypothetical protein AFB00_01105 [Pseudonocardia sp. HH130630-07]
MAGYDVKKDHPELYAPKPGRMGTVQVPEFRFLQVDGHGDPNTTQAYADAVATLYAVSYAVRAVAGRELDRVHTVAPLEGLWSAADPEVFATRDKARWDWTMMIGQPEWITDAIVEEGVAAAAKKGVAALDGLRFARYAEGLSVQVLHLGSYDDEGPVLAEMHDVYLPGNGYTWNGRHHEIYLSDPRRTAPEKLRTVLRQPVRPVTG